MNDVKPYYGSDERIRELARGFENCSLPDEDFDHRAHLMVAIWYLSSMPAEEAAARMRRGLLSYLAHYGADPVKYNETITQYWVRRLDKLLSETDGSLPLYERARQAVERAGESSLIFEYYSRERLFSEEAREGWLKPDLKPMES